MPQIAIHPLRAALSARLLAPAVALGLAAASLAAAAVTPTEMQAAYAAQAGAAGLAARGQSFFTSTHGKEWSCSSCHTPNPTGAGKHAATGKPIQPLAPSANPQRFTDTAKAEKWFRRNCGDVLGRECSAQEKADVMAWLQAQK